jgi:putative ABC transport system substrate-binding protein
MRRREFIKLFAGSAVAWPLVARAQQSTMPVIGFVSGTWPDADRLRALRQGLKETGHIEGENIIVTYGWAEGRFERLPAMIVELISRKVAVIVPVGTPPTLAAVAATKTIPHCLRDWRRPGQVWHCRQPLSTGRQCDRDKLGIG